jgi:hypothetical protein
MTKNARIIIIAFFILGAGGIGGTTWYFIKNTHKTSKVRDRAESDTLVQPTHYRTIASKPFKNVILEADFFLRD